MNRTSLVVVAFATLAALVAVPGLASGQGGPPFWSLTGNGGTDPAVNFVGTTDAADFIVKTNSTEAVRVTPGGHVGIGTASPGAFGIAEPLFSLDIRIRTRSRPTRSPRSAATPARRRCSCSR